MLLKEEPELLRNKEFMMGIFKPFRDELPPFREFYEHRYGKKTQYRVVRNLNKELPNRELLNELFYPQDPSNLETDYLLNDHGLLIAETLLNELTDKRKATHNHLSAVDGKYSWKLCADDEKAAGLKLHANNNVSESSFGTLTYFINTFNMIGLTNAGGMALARQNGIFNTEIPHAKNKDKGINNLCIKLATNFCITRKQTM